MVRAPPSAPNRPLPAARGFVSYSVQNPSRCVSRSLSFSSSTSQHGPQSKCVDDAARRCPQRLQHFHAFSWGDVGVVDCRRKRPTQPVPAGVSITALIHPHPAASNTMPSAAEVRGASRRRCRPPDGSGRRGADQGPPRRRRRLRGIEGDFMRQAQSFRQYVLREVTALTSPIEMPFPGATGSPVKTMWAAILGGSDPEAATHRRHRK